MMFQNDIDCKLLHPVADSKYSLVAQLTLFFKAAPENK